MAANQVLYSTAPLGQCALWLASLVCSAGLGAWATWRSMRPWRTNGDAA
jgi:hypothetical protein